MSNNRTEFTLSRREMAALPLGAAALAALNGAPAAARTLGESPSLEERAAIEDLFTTYVWVYDCENLEGFLNLFIDEDPVVVGRGVTHRGKEALAAWFAYLMDIRNRDEALWLHQALHHTYRRNGDSWLVYSYATHFSQTLANTGSTVRSLGYFVSELVSVGNEFRMRRFSINSWDRTTLPWSKPLPWAEADSAAG